MKANELMIGDYVNYRGQIIKVTSLYDKGGSNEVGWTDKESVWVNAANVEPIPLTPEILESNGFGYKENDTLLELHHYYLGEPQFCKNMDLHIGNKKDIFWIDYNNNHIGGIRYLHELQHALRLCGIDKEIEL